MASLRMEAGLARLSMVWLSGNDVANINKVTLRRAGLVLGWVTVRGYTILVFNQPLKPILSLAIHP